MGYKMTSPPVSHSGKLTREERWQYANFTNAYIFGVILEEHPDITKDIIRLAAPDLEIDEIIQIGREVRQNASFFSKMTFLDIQVRTGNGKVVLIEMQVIGSGDFIRRLRFYRSESDIESLGPGRSYGDLPDVIQIAICCFDPIGDGCYVYDYQMYDTVNQKTLAQNGQRIIILNAAGHKGQIGRELKAFLEYINGQETAGELVKKIDDTVSSVKYDETKRSDFMKLEDWINDIRYQVKLEAIQEGREEGLEEGRTIGLEEGRTIGLEEGRNLGLEEGRNLGIEEGRMKERIQGILTLCQTLKECGLSEEEALAKASEKYRMSVSDLRELIQDRQTAGR